MKLWNKRSPFFRPLLQVVVPAFLIAPSSLLWAEEDASAQAQQLINEMSRASQELSYDGIFVYRRGSRMDTMRLIHKNDGQAEQERMVSLTGVAREVIRDGNSVTCIFPDNQAVMVNRNRPGQFLTTQLPQPIEKIADYYLFSIGGKDRIAGRAAWVVNIVPRDDYRYGYQIWIDEETKLLLKSELKDDSGFPLEQILFTQLEIKQDIPAELLEPGISGQGYTWYTGAAEPVSADAGRYVWQVTSMPQGFSMSDREQQAFAEGYMPVEHMVYSDGLAMVSVFIEKIDNTPGQIKGASRMGGVNAYAVYANGYQVTAVGEVPQKTVQLMANSVVQGK